MKKVSTCCCAYVKIVGAVASIMILCLHYPTLFISTQIMPEKYTNIPQYVFNIFGMKVNLPSVSVDCPTRKNMLDNEHPTVFITLVCSVLATDPLSCILWYFKIWLVKT